jgi:uncharacterized protein YdiU (UPF0061 family)
MTLMTCIICVCIHDRFGSFEIVKPSDPDTHRAGPSAGREDVLRKLLDYTIATFYPSILAAHTKYVLPL